MTAKKNTSKNVSVAIDPKTRIKLSEAQASMTNFAAAVTMGVDDRGAHRTR